MAKNDEPVLRYRVTVASGDNDVIELRKYRQDFLEKTRVRQTSVGSGRGTLLLDRPVVSTYPVTITTNKYSGNSVTITSSATYELLFSS